MIRDDQVYLAHIVDALEQITTYTNGIDDETFRVNRMVQDAVIRQFEIVGEATKNLSDGFRERAGSGVRKPACDYSALKSHALLVIRPIQPTISSDFASAYAVTLHLPDRLQIQLVFPSHALTHQYASPSGLPLHMRHFSYAK